MLKPEEIQKRLESAKKVKPWVEARVERLKDAHPATREIGLLLMGCAPSGKQSAPDQHRQHWNRGAERLKELSPEELIRLGEALFPQFPDVFRAAWDMHARLPIQSGYARKPFRVANRPELVLEARRQFLFPLLRSLEGYDQDLPWIAAHAASLSYGHGAQQIGILLAAAIDMGGERGEQIEQVLRDSAAGTHEVGQFGRHVTAAFLCSSNPVNWEFIEKMLLAAQRQEGLRQVILETIDFSHPDAFRRMLRVIDENNLVRFSAIVRAANVWLGLQVDSVSAKYVEQTLHTIATFLDDDVQRQAALAGDEAEQAFFALWSIAFNDAPAAVEPAAKLLSHRKPDVRFIALHLLQMLGLPEVARPVLDAVEDADLRVAAYAMAVESGWLQSRVTMREVDKASGNRPYGRHVRIPPKDAGDLFERLERLFARTPEKAKDLKPLVWPWLAVKSSREDVASAMVLALGERPPARLLPYLPEMSSNARHWAADLLGLQQSLDETSRQALLELVGDAASAVRESAVAAMRRAKVAEGDLAALEPLLARKASDLRRGLLGLILSLDDAAVLSSAQRLIGSKNASQRLAGFDLLTQLKDAGRGGEAVAAIADSYKSARPMLERDEQVYLDKLLGTEQASITLDDALGLMDPARRTPPSAPQPRDVKFCTPAAIVLLKSLDQLIHEHREDAVTLKTYGGEIQQQPLGGIRHGFPGVFGRRWQQGKRDESESWKQPLEDLPLKDMWFDWWRNRPAEARDTDGLEVPRALLAASLRDSQKETFTGRSVSGWNQDALNSLLGEVPKLRYQTILDDVLKWVVAYEIPGGLADFSLDVFEALLAAIPGDKLTEPGQYTDYTFRSFVHSCGIVQILAQIAQKEGQWKPEHSQRIFGLKRWTDEPGVKIERSRDWEGELYEALAAGFANDHDVFDSLLGPRPGGRHGHRGFQTLGTGSAELRRGELPPRIAPLVQRAIDRILEIELARGEIETAATDPASSLRYAGGSDVLIRVLQAIGKDPKLQRNYSWGEASKGKSVVFSHLIRATFPAKDESPESFAGAVKAAGIGEEALLAVAFYAPQWARFVQAAVGWPMLEEAVWWIHGHTKDKSWRIDHDVREGWNAEIRKLTPLSLEDLMEGAVDVEWFRRTHEALGPKRWNRLDDFAKYASGSGGHKRAQLFASAMLGKEKRAALTQNIAKKRNQDSVRALGLVPLDKKSPKPDVLKRYQTIQEFVRGSRQFGSQRQASEKLAARIGQENLARTAGYPDPIRLQWAMEGLASADLAQGPVVARVKDLSVTLAVDSDGLPEITVARKDKPLKAVPPEAKKDAKIEELLERKTDLRRSASRMRQSLELAMCRGDRFGREELIDLMGNIVLRPMLERLVFITDAAPGAAGVVASAATESAATVSSTVIAGYPTGGGKALRDHAGKIEPIKSDEVLRLAHPSDFLRLGHWTQWQHDCFTAERVQPFKQVFRELYVLTGQEKSDSTFSRRYAGQQINPRQAMALLGSRGWVAAPEAGVFRTFHDEKLIAWIEFMESFYTPAEVEGLTLEKVRFAVRGGREYAKLTDIPPRLFSEVMRDVDLVVSVAHRGAVDPEASASTVELRASLLRETLTLLKIDNVKIKEPHIHIKGSLAEYSVHLGSATTHMLPGGTLFIVPVHSQHRGRIFLPFADDDPKTAEIISKVMLLARDEELRDPNLLDQIKVRSC